MRRVARPCSHACPARSPAAGPRAAPAQSRGRSSYAGRSATRRSTAYSSGLTPIWPPAPACIPRFVFRARWRFPLRVHARRAAIRASRPDGRRYRYAMFAIDYRLAPRFPFPAAEHDVLDAVPWVRRNATRLRVDPRRLVLFGASAGGSLAALAATEPHGPLDVGDRVRAAISRGPVRRTSPATTPPSRSRPSTSAMCRPRVPCATGPPLPSRMCTGATRRCFCSTPPPSWSPWTKHSDDRGAAGRARPQQLLTIPGDRHAAQYAAAAWPSHAPVPAPLSYALSPGTCCSSISELKRGGPADSLSLFGRGAPWRDPIDREICCGSDESRH